jgi:hypothetical protein
MTRVLKKARLGGLASAFAVFEAAVDVARAIDAHRMPSTGALKTLGINEDDFRKSHAR